MFDTHAQYTVALLHADAVSPLEQHEFEVAGVAQSAEEFRAQSMASGIMLSSHALGPALEVPLLPSQEAADLLGKLRRAEAFPLGGGRWRCFPTRELHETDDQELWRDSGDGLPLWKGESFDQFLPHGAGARLCPMTDLVRERTMRPKAGSESSLASKIPITERVTAQKREAQQARVAFRDATNRTNSRTVLACLVPPGVLLVNSAPYLVFMDDRDVDRACCLGLMNSLPFDWQARRFAESHVSYFILEGLRVPALDEETNKTIAVLAARLSAWDERFADFAAATGVEVGPLTPDEREALRAEIDARVAHAWGLDTADLETIFADFTLAAVPEPYRQRVRDRFAELAGE